MTRPLTLLSFIAQMEHRGKMAWKLLIIKLF
jgi:hypothetical protein